MHMKPQTTGRKLHRHQTAPPGSRRFQEALAPMYQQRSRNGSAPVAPKRSPIMAPRSQPLHAPRAKSLPQNHAMRYQPQNNRTFRNDYRQVDATSKKDSVCRHYKQGYCRMNEKCQFRHEGPQQPRRKASASGEDERKVCAYWLKNNTCNYGDQCKFRHERPIPDAVQNSMKKLAIVNGVRRLCKFHQGGQCRAGDDCMFLHSPEAKSIADRCVALIEDAVTKNENGRSCMMFQELSAIIGEDQFLKWGYDEAIEFINDIDPIFVVEHETDGYMLFMGKDPKIPLLTREHLEKQIKNFIRKHRNEEGYVVLTNMLKHIRLDHEHFGFERKIDFLHAIHGIRIEQKPHVVLYLAEDCEEKMMDRPQQAVIDDVLNYIFHNRKNKGGVPLTKLLSSVNIPFESWGFQRPGDFIATIPEVLIEKKPHMMLSLKLNYLKNKLKEDIVSVNKTRENAL